MNRLTRPAYVLAHNADQSGCGYHRIINPLGNLARLGVMIGRADMQIWQPDMLRLMAPDVVVWQRQNEEHQIANMARYREVLPQASIVYEIDDALWAVPAWSYHAPYIPHDIEERIAKAVTLCDVITVSTRTLGKEMRRICGDSVPVRVVPNMLGQPEFDWAAASRAAARRPHAKPRIGWGGGISHTGDLALIKTLMEQIGAQVEWVFLGMKPEGVSVPVEFHQGVSCQQYLPTLAGLDLDLMLAPLEDNLFNRCKSNLRLIEAGACHYPVIASPVEPYVEGNPPVRYANTPEEWIEQVQQFLHTDVNEGEKLHHWAVRNYCIDTKAEERSQGWLKGTIKPFKPHGRTAPSGFTIVCPQPQAWHAQLGDVETNLAAACNRTGHVLYIAPNAVVTPSMIERMLKHLEHDVVACATALSNDGGIAGFPGQWKYVPMTPELGEKVDAICADRFRARDYVLPFATGSFIGLNKRVLDQIGHPLPSLPGQELASIIEWSMLAQARNKQIRAAADIFCTVTAAPPGFDVEQLLRRGQVRYPPVKIPMDPLAPVRTQIELTFHRLHYTQPVPSGRPGYQEWAAIFDTIGAKGWDGMAQQQAHMPMISFGIHMQPGATIEPQSWLLQSLYDASTLRTLLVQAAEGNDPEWIVFSRSDAIVRSHALHMFADAVEKNPAARLLYADHDYVTNGQRGEHDCKPATFDHDMLLGRDYITPIFAVRRDLLGELDDVALSDVGLFHMVLDAVRNVDRKEIVHVPRMLAHLREFRDSKEADLTRRKMVAVQQHLNELGWHALVAPHPYAKRYLSLSWDLPETPPLVTIIMPTKDRRDMIQPCLDSLLARTEYPNFEVLVIDNGSTNVEHKKYLQDISERDPRVRCLLWDEPYNWSALNNFAASFARGDLLLFLNDDTRFVEGKWLTEMVGAALRPHVGAVGARLIYPFGAIQHVGVACNNGMTGHILKGMPEGQPGYNGYAIVSHEATAVTGACMLVRKDVFEEVGGFDERMPHNFNDVAFCARLFELGYRNVVTCAQPIQHIEGATRPNLKDDGAKDRMQAEGRVLQSLFPKPDPYWNPHFMLVHYEGGVFVHGMNLDTFVWPGRRWPWQETPAFEPERVMVIGDDGRQYQAESRDGNIVYVAAVNGFHLQIVQPTLQNVAPVDIRDPKPAAAMLAELGITRVVLRSLAGSPQELLGFLRKMNVALEYTPLRPEAVCPRLDFKREGKNCNDGWLKGECRDCIERHGSAFGIVNIVGWQSEWAKFLEQASVDATDLDDNGRSALEHVYPESRHR